MLDSISMQTVGYAFIGGMLPALMWLYFLLKEDYKHPEPRTVLLIAFVAGMAAVPLAVPLESYFRDYAYASLGCSAYSTLCLPIITGWAVVEETLKYGLAALFVLWRRDVDESIDLVIYMLTVALGFAALENMLFLVEPFATHDFLAALATDNLRFVGSTLLHVIASSAIGFSLAFSFRMRRRWRALVASGGLILAIGLHTTFNFLIIPRDDSHSILTAFLFVWGGAAIFFALFELLKYFQYRAEVQPTA
ncbi:MAG: PrsW family glutamic-type intramembrane protease [Patescibacteria group bacterium]